MKSFLFKEFLLKRVISGHKTETRRSHGLETVNKDPSLYHFVCFGREPLTDQYAALFIRKNKKSDNVIPCIRKYAIGEIVYLKENYTDLPDGTIVYQMDIPIAERKNYKWKSKLMMPASKARHFVKITAIDCHQIQDISPKSAIAEGIQTSDSFYLTSLEAQIPFEKRQHKIEILAFQSLWKLVNGDQSWTDNIWVFAYTFEYLPNYKIS